MWVTSTERARGTFWTYLPYATPILVFAFPLLFFIAWDLDDYDPTRVHTMADLNNHTTPDRLSPVRYLGWILFLLVVFASYQVLHVARVTIEGRHDFVTGSEAVARLLYDGSLLYIVAGIRDKMYWTEQQIPDGVFVGLVAMYSLVFSIMFRWSKTSGHTVALKASVMTWGMFCWVFVPSIGVVVTAVVYHLMTAWRVSPDFFWMYMTVVILWIAGHVAAYAAHGRRFHLHHWYWGLYAAHACIFNTDASIMCQAAFVAVYLHGMSIYGPTSIFEPEVDETQYAVV